MPITQEQIEKLTAHGRDLADSQLGAVVANCKGDLMKLAMEIRVLNQSALHLLALHAFSTDPDHGLTPEQLLESIIEKLRSELSWIKKEALALTGEEPSPIIKFEPRIIR